jgi:hypothetical protein
MGPIGNGPRTRHGSGVAGFSIGGSRGVTAFRQPPAPALQHSAEDVNGAGVGQFRLMTWNVENLFDVGDEDGPETQAELTMKIESLRAVIDNQKPHLLALQEIG